MEKEVYKENEKIFKALANRRRLAIIAYLKKDKEATVGEVARKLKLSFNATSKHLRILYLADIVEEDQRALEVYYRLSQTPPTVFKSALFHL